MITDLKAIKRCFINRHGGKGINYKLALSKEQKVLFSLQNKTIKAPIPRLGTVLQEPKHS